MMKIYHDIFVKETLARSSDMNINAILQRIAKIHSKSPTNIRQTTSFHIYLLFFYAFFSK